MRGPDYPYSLIRGAAHTPTEGRWEGLDVQDVPYTAIVCTVGGEVKSDVTMCPVPYCTYTVFLWGMRRGHDRFLENDSLPSGGSPSAP